MLSQKDSNNYFQLRQIDKFLTGHNGFAAGGCFKNLFSGEKIKDVDIFFRNKKDFDDAVAAINKDADTYRFFYENQNVKAYKHKDTNITVELCCKIFGTPMEILRQFDFTITKFAYYKEAIGGAVSDNPFTDVTESVSTEKYSVLFDENFFEHLYLKRLVIDDQIPYPMSTLDRTYRYARYGFFPCMETKLKLAKAIHDLPVELIEVAQSLYDGVD